MSGRWEVINFIEETHKVQNLLDGTDIRPLSGHLDLFHHIFREWSEEADEQGEKDEVGTNTKKENYRPSGLILMELIMRGEGW